MLTRWDLRQRQFLYVAARFFRGFFDCAEAAFGAALLGAFALSGELRAGTCHQHRVGWGEVPTTEFPK